MSSTYLSLHYHLVFSTKNRAPSIAAPWRSRLHEYLGGTISGLGGFSEGVGGVDDHVHLLVGLKATHCLADVLRELKKASSVWVHQEIGLASFAWQQGYAAFTVSATAREAVQSYIANQEAHHRKQSLAEHIDPALQAASWGVVDGSRIRREYPITLRRLEGVGRRGKAITSEDNLPPLLKLKYDNAIADAIADLGRAEEIGNMFAGFQKFLYDEAA